MQITDGYLLNEEMVKEFDPIDLLDHLHYTYLDVNDEVIFHVNKKPRLLESQSGGFIDFDESFFDERKVKDRRIENLERNCKVMKRCLSYPVDFSCKDYEGSDIVKVKYYTLQVPLLKVHRRYPHNDFLFVYSNLLHKAPYQANSDLISFICKRYFRINFSTVSIDTAVKIINRVMD
jgi:hypothetical protein